MDVGHELDKEFGIWLKRQRERLGLGLSEASELTGLSINRILELECGWGTVSILPKEVKLFAYFYGLEPEHLEHRILGVFN